MENLLAHLLILVFILCMQQLLQPSVALRKKRSNSLADATHHNGGDDDDNNSSSSGNITATTMPAFTMGLITLARADQNATATTGSATSATPTAAAATTAEQESSDFAAHLLRSKKHMLAAESLHHVRCHTLPSSTPAGPPYFYYNKLVSPDGKQEVKEFQLMAPNMIIEGVQQDMNYGPVADMDGVLLVNNGLVGGHLRPLAAKPSKHHHKRKSSSLAVPPFLFMLQQMLQPGLSVELDAQRNRLDASPLYQYIDSAVDNAMRSSSNREIFEPERELELNDNKDKEKLMDRDGIDLLALESSVRKTTPFELGGKGKDAELIVTCPIRHEHHASNNGEIVDNDVVLVNECNIV